MDNSPKIPLCVDMDGTLLRVDSLHEQFAALFKKRPLSLLELFVWRLHGKAYLKKRISELSDTNISLLPIHKPFYAYLESQKKEGRKLLLVTGANERVAQAMIKTYPIFDDYLASSESHNLSGKNKANALIKRFGEKQFDYAGNSSCDLHVWKHCRKAIVVHACPSVKNKAKALCEIEVLFDKEKTPAKTYLRAMRIHHWVKNILIFIPMLLAHHTIADTLRTTGLAFLSFSFCASAVYILNDILDIASDRVHPTKQNRPIASGDISIKCGFFMILILLLLSAICAHFVAAGFIAILFIYALATTGYSFYFKKIAILDVLILAFLYVIRIFAGSIASAVPISNWFLAFATFFFLSLAFSKRFCEILFLLKQSQDHAHGRDYLSADLQSLSSLGASSGYICVLIFALYISNPEINQLYSQPDFLWLVCPALIYWISRVWLLSHRGRMRQDPIVFALKDPVSYLVFGLCAVILFLAI